MARSLEPLRPLGMSLVHRGPEALGHVANLNSIGDLLQNLGQTALCWGIAILAGAVVGALLVLGQDIHDRFRR